MREHLRCVRNRPTVAEARLSMSTIPMAATNPVITENGMNHVSSPNRSTPRMPRSNFYDELDADATT